MFAAVCRGEPRCMCVAVSRAVCRCEPWCVHALWVCRAAGVLRGLLLVFILIFIFSHSLRGPSTVDGTTHIESLSQPLCVRCVCARRRSTRVAARASRARGGEK